MVNRSPCCVGQLAHVPGVVLDHQLGDRLPQVPEEPLGDLQAVRPPGRSSPAGTAAGRSRAAVWNSSRISAVQFCEPFSQLSMCVATSALPGQRARRPRSAWPSCPSKFASMPSLLSLSHSSPRPLAGAGAFSAPVLVCPKRRIVHLPVGHVPGQPAVAVHLRAEVDDPARGRSPSPAASSSRLRGADAADLDTAAFGLDVRDAVRARRRKRQHGDVAVEAGDRLRLRQRALETLRALARRSRSRRPSASTARA